MKILSLLYAKIFVRKIIECRNFNTCVNVGQRVSPAPRKGKLSLEQIKVLHALNK
ncbi:MAG: hypothetical protein ABJC04_01220 [Verrucomicrobiota bacterium]